MSALTLDAFALTAPGCATDANEDAVLMLPEAGVFVVADGVGGRPAGALASRAAIAAVVELTAETPEGHLDEEGARRLAEEANRRVRALGEADPTMAGAATTLSALLAHGAQGTIVHVGDSKILLFREGELRQITRDHTLEAETHAAGRPPTPLNPQLAGMLTRSIGAAESVVADVMSLTLEAGDRVLLATDGVTKVISVDQMRGILVDVDAGSNEEDDGRHSAERACTAVFGAARERGLADDTTLGVVSVSTVPAKEERA